MKLPLKREGMNDIKLSYPFRDSYSRTESMKQYLQNLIRAETNVFFNEAVLSAKKFQRGDDLWQIEKCDFSV